MDLANVFSPDRTRTGVNASSKKRAIESAAYLITDSLTHLEIGHVYRGLLDRERLGTTALGNGVAIPHCRLKELDAIAGALMVFNEPIDYDAPDGLPIDMMFVLLVPEDETEAHLKVLGELARRCEQERFRTAVKAAGSDQQLFDLAFRAQTK